MIEEVVSVSAPNMQLPSVVPPPPPVLARGHRVAGSLPRRSARLWGLPLFVLGAAMPFAGLISSFVMIDRYATAPGDAESVNDRVTLSAVDTFDPDGDILFVTVAGGQMNALSAFQGLLDPDVNQQNRRERFGDSNPETERLRSFSQMQRTKEYAPYVALTRLGYDTSAIAGDAIIDFVYCREVDGAGGCAVFYPADEFLEPGDQIVSLNGVEILSSADVGDAMKGVKPGADVPVVVRRLDPKTLQRLTTTEAADVPTVADNQDPNRAIFGVQLADTRVVKLPFAVDIDTGKIGGPSAGLAFTLALIDELTPGELTGGMVVAVTGSIDFDGRVGAIGGLRQKAVAVKQADGDAFIVPASQNEEDLAVAREILGADRVFPVSTVEEALEVLRGLGGNVDDLPPVGS